VATVVCECTRGRGCVTRACRCACQAGQRGDTDGLLAPTTGKEHAKTHIHRHTRTRTHARRHRHTGRDAAAGRESSGVAEGARTLSGSGVEDCQHDLWQC
jgi:hypothetical protein